MFNSLHDLNLSSCFISRLVFAIIIRLEYGRVSTNFACITVTQNRCQRLEILMEEDCDW